MNSDSQQILGHKSRKIWILLGIVSIVLVSLLGLERERRTRGRPHSSAQHHKVLLTWGASSSPGVGYNVYRSTTSDSRFLKVNPALIQGLTFTDDTVENGVTYTYVARAAGALGNESPNSPQFVITIPPN